MSYGKKVQLEIQGHFTKFSDKLKGALNQIQEECNRQDERISEVESLQAESAKSLEELKKSIQANRDWNDSRWNCLTDKQNDIQAALDNFEQKFVKFNALLLDCTTSEIRYSNLSSRVEKLEQRMNDQELENATDVLELPETEEALRLSGWNFENSKESKIIQSPNDSD
jgi:chromosome segregation ATPase